MALSQTSVLKLYNTVIDDVISGVREAFLDEGVDEQVLQELKQIWENKLMSSKAVELNPDPPEPQPPQINTTKNSSSKSKKNANATQAAAAAAAAPQAREPSPEIHQQASPSETFRLPTPSPPKPQPQPTRIQPQPQQMQHMQNMALQQQIKQQPQQQLIPQQQQVANQPSTSTINMPDKQVSIQIKLPVHGQLPERLITIHVPASAIHGNQLHQLFTGPIITAAIGLPMPFATSLLQQHVNQTFEGLPGFTPIQVQPFQIVDSGANHMLQQQQLGIQGQQGNIAQLDGAAGDSSDEEFDEEEENDEIEDDNNDDDDDDDDDNNSSSAREEEPLNSEDDVTDDDPTDLFDTDNVVVCQYDKITRSRNKWKFYLKDGIMNLSGKDFVFQKANGDAEW